MVRTATPVAYERAVARIAFIENRDSFSWNVIDALPFLRDEIQVVHVPSLELREFDGVVIGPGPTDPIRAGLVELVHEVARRQLPLLGICLGHQALGLAFGASLRRAVPTHGKPDVVHFDGGERWGLEGSHQVMRYHSLALHDVRSPLRTIGALSDGTPMAVMHESLPMIGLQFHPDSFGSPTGREMLARIFRRASRPRRMPIRPSGPTREESVTPVKLSSLDGSFALLAPGYGDEKTWTLIDEIEPAPQGSLWFAPAEGQPRRYDGRRRQVALEFDVAAEPPVVTLAESGHLAAVEAIREAIAAGDVYQVNLTVRAALSDVSGAGLFAQLCRRGVPRFAAWVRSPELGEWVTASPELLVETEGRWVHTEPMKGTAAPQERERLLASAKERAELAMITDLLRDDLQHVCVPGTVTVTDERRLIELPYVVQSVADIEGELRPDVTLGELLGVVHPGGSVTGTPRPAALEQIARLETSARGAYCGTLGLTTRTLSRFSLLIRTAERTNEGWRYGVGGGITWDSNPRDEWNEVQLKLGALTAK